MRERVADCRSRAWRKRAVATTAAFVLSIASVPRLATAEPPPPRDWDLELDLYGWIPATDLDIDGTALGEDFSRTFDKHLDDAFSDLDGGGGGDVRFRWKRLVGYFDGAWVQTDENSKGWFTNSLADAKLGVRVLDLNAPFSSPLADEKPRITLDLLAGARYRRSQTNLDIFTTNGETRWHDDREWVDPLIGIAWEIELMKNLRFGTVADIGGFDVGNASSLAWSINPRLSYRAWDHLNLFVGWKHLSEDKDSNFETTISGPQAGIGWTF